VVGNPSLETNCGFSSHRFEAGTATEEAGLTQLYQLANVFLCRYLGDWGNLGE